MNGMLCHRAKWIVMRRNTHTLHPAAMESIQTLSGAQPIGVPICPMGSSLVESIFYLSIPSLISIPNQELPMQHLRCTSSHRRMLSLELAESPPLGPSLLKFNFNEAFHCTQQKRLWHLLGYLCVCGPHGPLFSWQMCPWAPKGWWTMACPLDSRSLLLLALPGLLESLPAHLLQETLF